ncbi:MAG TPA: serine/threonine-protein kinase, partial [Verrucomicrobiae bacterium]|nr:serine/threonine-protein kinase [Verrucomicrobiae bacterium]
DQHQLNTRQRLDLFIQVCRAVQHAHQKGIIHRDLKPSNILVALQDGQPVPKVIDFGIAKATQGRLTDQTLFTAFEQFLGTPAYMSPEQTQLGSLDVDTRSDIYSLGVLLYELLTGTTPFDTKELVAAGLDEMRRTIREVDPVRPSTRLTQTTKSETRSPKSEKSEMENRKSEIPSDLDWIVMKCLEKDRARRYETATGLARDIERHLNNEPVIARPPSKLYEFQKTVRRHKFGFAATATVILVLVIGAALSTWQAVRATRAEQKSVQFAQFLTDMLKGVGPSVALGRDTALLKEILAKATEQVETNLVNQPEVEADLRTTIGDVYMAVCDNQKAEVMYRRALGIRRHIYGEQNRYVANSLRDLAVALSAQGYLDESEEMSRRSLTMLRRLRGSSCLEVAQPLSNLGLILYFQADLHLVRREAALVEAETLLREALAIQRSALSSGSLEATDTLCRLALVLTRRNKSPEAEVLANEALESYRKRYGQDHPALGHISDILGQALQVQGKLAEAEVAFRQAMAVRQKFLGGNHSDLRYTFQHLGALFLSQGRWAEAEDMFRKLVARQGEQLVYGESFLAEAVSGLSASLCAQGKWKQAQSELREAAERGQAQILNAVGRFLAVCPDSEIYNPSQALAFAEKAVEATARTNAMYLDTLAIAYAATGQFTNAISVQREAITLLRSDESKKDYLSRLRLFEANQRYRDHYALAATAGYMLNQRKLAEAEELLRECLILREEQTPNDWQTFSTRSQLGGALLGQTKYPDADQFLRSGYEGMKARETSIPADSKVRLKEALERLVNYCEATDRPDQAAEWKQKLAEFEKAQQSSRN